MIIAETKVDVLMVIKYVELNRSLMHRTTNSQSDKLTEYNTGIVEVRTDRHSPSSPMRENRSVE